MRHGRIRRAPPKGRAFIYYWPPPKGNTQPTLAVKDLIDMKGVVTTAGSKTRPPAVRDAKCLAGARAKNVYIVGKTNLSEFALTVSGVRQRTSAVSSAESFPEAHRVDQVWCESRRKPRNYSERPQNGKTAGQPRES
jgi:hypothetical protein